MISNCSSKAVPLFVANYPKKSLYGLTLTKSLGQFHDWQRNIHRLIAKNPVLVIELKK